MLSMCPYSIPNLESRSIVWQKQGHQVVRVYEVLTPCTFLSESWSAYCMYIPLRVSTLDSSPSWKPFIDSKGQSGLELVQVLLLNHLHDLVLWIHLLFWLSLLRSKIYWLNIFSWFKFCQTQNPNMNLCKNNDYY